ncbi:MAG: AAA family ATPase [Chitinophagales bacterium]
MNQRKRILKGHSNFKYIVENGGYFVDKTLLIKDFYYDADHVLLMPRPRRFGKTLNLSMIEHFFDIQEKENNNLFSEFLIDKETDFCKQHQNQYPVINISLKKARGENWERCYAHIEDLITNLYRHHDYLLESNQLKSYEKKEVEKFILKKFNQTECESSLKKLSKYLHIHFGKKSIILVDEYDTPVIGGYKNGYYKSIIGFLKVFMGDTFKENDYLQKGLITGIMRIARESIFSEMNNVGVYTILDPFYTGKFGFTESETQEILSYFNLKDKLEEVKQWYDGYKFGTTTHVYNPWSIVNYIDRNKQGFKAYWINTGTDALIKERITEPDLNNTYNTLEKLIAGESVEKRLDENFVFPDFKTDRELLWTLLTFSGYLTIVEEVSRKQYLLRLPNYEIKTVFQDIVISWLRQNLKVRRESLIETTEHLLNNRLKDFERGFQKIIGDTFSFFDTAGEPEKVYQAYVLGLLAVIGDDYIIRSNRESGEGRYDIMIMPHNKSQKAIIMELKQIQRNKKESDGNFHKRINQTLKEAAQQIARNQYHKELLAHQIPKEQIVEVSVVFGGKVPYVLPLVLE